MDHLRHHPLPIRFFGYFYRMTSRSGRIFRNHFITKESLRLTFLATLYIVKLINITDKQQLQAAAAVMKTY